MKLETYRTKANWDQKPKDDKTWWLRSHCTPGTLDEKAMCAFCGETHEKCAKENTESIKEKHKQNCGGSGFWCPGCGLFFPQDTCGEQSGEDYKTLSGKRVHLVNLVSGEKFFCHCGEYLFDLK